MSKIRGKNTKPEITLRKALHAEGIRYRLHSKSLPGRPDIVLPKYKAVIEINGCFWHGHNCHLFKWPKTRRNFWQDKINGNIERDIRNINKLLEQDWRVMIVWECALKGKRKTDPQYLSAKVIDWLKSDSDFETIQGST
tara:strand:- start:229 stop:645 length:417 start_codon:yes stop_codon:yes gene_type:complete